MTEQNQPEHDDSPTTPFIPRRGTGAPSRAPGRESTWNTDLPVPSARQSARGSVKLAGHVLLDGTELARRMNVGRTTVWRLAKSGQIPYFVMGRRWVFDEAEVLEALRAPKTARAGGPEPRRTDPHHS